jgi:uncharacterized protein YndB with AHSA1/START domain
MGEPVVRTQMLIRRPVAEVFEAFTDPAITTKFWFTKSSGKLEPGGRVQWTWEMYEASADVTVKEIEPNRRILVEWDGYGTTLVEWVFEPRTDDSTFVTITNSGFSGDDAVGNALDSQGGFSFLLAGAKAYLEHGIELNLVVDHTP